MKTLLLTLMVLAALPQVTPDRTPKEFDQEMKIILKRQLMGEIINRCSEYARMLKKWVDFSDEERWQSNNYLVTFGFICQEISQPEGADVIIPKYYKSYLIAEEDYNEMRRVWKNLMKLYLLETPLLKECFHEKGWFWECIITIRQKYIGIGYGDSFERMKNDWQQFQRENLDNVRHCFLYHQEDKSPECKGITYDRPEIEPKYKLNDRDHLRMFAWYKFASHVRPKGEAIGKDLVISCLFERATNATLHEEACKILRQSVNNGSEKPTPAQLAKYGKEIVLYQEAVKALKMEDCVLYHNHETLQRCKHLSWDDEHFNATVRDFHPKVHEQWMLWSRASHDQLFQDLPEIAIPAIPEYPWIIPEPAPSKLN